MTDGEGNPRSRAVRAFRATPRLPGDKSVTHRAYLAAALVDGEYRVTGPNPGEDCRHTRDALGALGVRWSGEPGDLRLRGAGGALRRAPAPLDLGNSGTGLRLLLGVLAAQPWEVVLTGDASLRARPMERVLEPLRLMGARAASTAGGAPVTLRGGALRGIDYTLPVPSAQIKSAILLAGLRARGRTTIRGDAGSRDHTEVLLRYLGCMVGREGEAVTLDPGPLVARDIHVPGDTSAAVFHALAAAIVPGAAVGLADVGLNPTRTRVFTVLSRLGAKVRITEAPEGGDPEPRGRVEVTGETLRALDLGPDATAALIDELPALAVAAAFADGTSRITGAGELRHKESNRLETVAAALEAVGARVRRLPDGWEITGSGGAPLPGGTVSTRGDHRIGMAFLVAGLRCRHGVVLGDDHGIETSDPYFLSNLNRILEDAA